MRAVALGIALALVGVGCGGGGGGGGGSRGQRAGSEPVPSSQAAAPGPASSGPRFAGSSAGPPQLRAGERPGGLIGRIMADEERRRREERGPERLEDPMAEGRRIALETMAGMAEPERGERDDEPCVQAWNLRVAQGRRQPTRAEFLQRCRALPADQQQCMSPSYQGAHLEECAMIGEREGRATARRAGLDPNDPSRPLRR